MIRLLVLVSVVGVWGSAFAQKIPAQVVSGNAGKAEADGVVIFSNAGLGMAVGTATADGVIIRHGFLVGGTVVDDDEAPQITEPDDIAAVTDANRCAAVVAMPDIEVTDNRDINPTVTMVIQTQPPQEVEQGEEVLLPRGSYDVVVTAEDRQGNSSRASFRIDVEDQTPATIVELPNPTPADGQAEATSPLGTPVNIAFECDDNCDPDPVGSRDPAGARFALGATDVTVVCTDEDGNASDGDIVIRVQDTTPPRVAGALPQALAVECNSPQGARIDVPEIVWQDAGYPANQLQVSLILDPGAGERVFEDVPEQLTLLSGAHVLRYVAEDPAGNVAQQDLRVQVADTAAPELEVIRAPENGWNGGDGALEVVFELTDGCSQDELQFEIAPQPTSISRDGNQITVTYEEEGIYELAVAVTDGDGNTTRDNTVAFGIDRNAPEAVLNGPAQGGVDPDDSTTWPLFALAEALALDAGGADDADGQVSGIARVQVVLDPGTNRERTLADHRFELQGSPRRGPRVGRNVGCTGDADVGCNDDEAFELRMVPPGEHVLEVTVTDAAGNTDSSRGYFRSADLNMGAGLLRPQLLAMARENGVDGGVAQRLNLAGTLLGQVIDLTDGRIPDSRWRTPRFLGPAILSANTATIRLTQALAAAQGDRPDRITEVLDFLHRFIRSDIALMHAYTLSLDHSRDPDYLADALDTDDEFTQRALDLMGRAIAAEQWTDSMGNAQLAFFHAKSAYEQWLMDYHYVPAPANIPAVLGEYGAGAAILEEISDEIGAYLQIGGVPGAQFMERLRERTTLAAERLTQVSQRGFDVRNGGLSDQAYIEALLELRDASNFSAVAGNQGAWVRNYQWSMMQVVRFMTQASVEDAMFNRGGNRQAWPLYTTALAHIADGVELLDERRIQGLIDLYGEIQEVACLLVAVYHCDFLDDEANDQDDPIPVEDVPEACWDTMWQPEEWPDVVGGGRPARCQFGDEVSAQRE